MASRYDSLAPVYDAVSGEYPIYRPARLKAIGLLAPRAGDQVLDLGCGTGLNFAPLLRRVGPGGLVVGIDSSAAMLRAARRRANRAGARNVVLLRADATALDARRVAAIVVDRGGRPAADAALATYALSLMADPAAAWAGMAALARPGARVAVVDMQDPVGAARVLAPLARLAARLGGADLRARTWQFVERHCTEVVAAQSRGGHIQVRAGRLRAGAARPEATAGRR